MGTVIALALVPPVLLILGRGRFAVDIPKALLLTIGLTLLVTTGVVRLLMSGSEDPGVVVAILLLGAPCVAVPIAAVAATSIVGVSGYGLAAALMALGGWSLGLIALLFTGSPDLHGGITTALLALLAIPSSCAATSAVYAAALGKRSR